MYEAPVISAEEEAALLKEWFETVHFDEESEGIPPLDPERDDENRHLVGKHDQSTHAHPSPGGTATPALSNRKADDLAERVQTPDGGFTVDPRTGKDIKEGFAVAIYPDRSRELQHTKVNRDSIRKYADDNSDLLSQEGNMMGGWHDPDTGNVWLDVSRVTTNRREAIDLAKEHNQIAIFDLGSGNSINTGGTGRSSYPFVFRQARHLPGKHDQSTHGKGGKPNPVGKDDPNMLVMSSNDVYPFGSSWQASDNMETRAGGLWSESYAGHKQVTKAIANNKAGKPTLDGIDAEKGHQLTLLQAGAQDLPNGTRTPGKYKKENLEADIKNSASVLQSKMDNAPTTKTPLYRGLLMSKDKLPKQGDTFDTPISSWSKNRENAEVYAYARPNERLGIVGDHAVVMRVVGPKKAGDISDIVGSGIIDDELVMQGKFKVNRVTKKGRSVNIEVEQVND